MDPVVVIGAGMGGLTAAIRLARQGFAVRMLEARPSAGGLAANVTYDGLRFDTGPYILLDRNGLEWAFAQAGMVLADHVDLLPIPEVYQVATTGKPTISFYHDLARTADGFERLWPGSGQRYRAFIGAMTSIHSRLEPLLHRPRPGIRDLLTTGAWRHLRFLGRPLQRILAESQLPVQLQEAIAIWTHVAGQDPASAPSPLAFVPALIHGIGACYPRGGIGAIAIALAAEATRLGVPISYKTVVRRIATHAGAVGGVELQDGTMIPTRTVVSNASGIATYTDLVDHDLREPRQRLKRLPLQSPGLCISLAVTGSPAPPYLHFQLPGSGAMCRLLVQPAVVLCESANGWSPARLIVPMRHGDPRQVQPADQLAFADQLLDERWWKERFTGFRILDIRTPTQWGTAFHLYRDSINPVMTSAFMRAGRLAHRSPWLSGLYLAGAATHPGQWVSFCAMSGIHAASCVIADAR